MLKKKIQKKTDQKRTTEAQRTQSKETQRKTKTNHESTKDKNTKKESQIRNRRSGHPVSDFGYCLSFSCFCLSCFRDWSWSCSVSSVPLWFALFWDFSGPPGYSSTTLRKISRFQLTWWIGQPCTDPAPSV